ncbi:unnamed protein product [Arctogadus glacialis]
MVEHQGLRQTKKKMRIEIQQAFDCRREHAGDATVFRAHALAVSDRSSSCSDQQDSVPVAFTRTKLSAQFKGIGIGTSGLVHRQGSLPLQLQQMEPSMEPRVWCLFWEQFYTLDVQVQGVEEIRLLRNYYVTYSFNGVIGTARRPRARRLVNGPSKKEGGVMVMKGKHVSKRQGRNHLSRNTSKWPCTGEPSLHDLTEFSRSGGGTPHHEPQRLSLLQRRREDHHDSS